MEQGYDWKAWEKKWRKGIPTETASKADFTEYLLTKLHGYDESGITDHNLLELFQDDFKDFTTMIFKRAYTPPELQRLRAYLRCGGVYVEQNHKRLSIPQSLFNVLKEETIY